MSQFLSHTLTDIRQGRESWRVFVTFCTPSFALAILIAARLS
jgi:hypothetical protein